MQPTAAVIAEAPVAQVNAPLLSARRAPGEIADTLALANLRAALFPVAQTVAAAAPGTSCLSVSVGGSSVVDVGAERLVIPASNLKIITAAVAFEVLGPDYRFVTTANGVLNGDTIEGDLVLVGGGDPLLAVGDYPTAQKYPQTPATQLVDLVVQLQAAGVTRVTGNIVADESRYDTERWAPGWTDDNKGLVRRGSIPEAGPLSALMVNDSVDGANEQRRPLDDSALNAAEKFRGLLTFVGIEVTGSAVVGGPTIAPAIAQISSAPLSDVAAEALLNSDNNTAELILKEVGLAKTGQGTSAAGAQVELDQLAAWGIPTTGLRIVDGSGLSPDNRVSCSTLTAVLDRLGAGGPLFEGLPIAGVSGTLGPLDADPAKPDNPEQFDGTDVFGVLRAKSGTLGRFGTKGLSGILPANLDPSLGVLNGQPIAFSMIGNVDAGDQAITEAIVLPWWRQLAEGFSELRPTPTADQLAPPGS